MGPQGKHTFVSSGIENTRSVIGGWPQWSTIMAYLNGVFE